VSADRRDPNPDTLLYRLEIGGAVDGRWADWFGADSVRTRGDTTVLEVRVADQSELYGRLRRIHDLNLKLISVTRTQHTIQHGED
jgi:hypothetical protein